jgi:uncharacterized protein (UPF0332 family)
VAIQNPKSTEFLCSNKKDARKFVFIVSSCYLFYTIAERQYCGLVIMTKLQKIKEDVKNLIDKSKALELSLAYDLTLDKAEKEKANKIIEENKLDLINFRNEYEKWYSEALEVIKRVLPSRYEDFRCLYKDDKRKTLDYLTYTMSDYMINVKNANVDSQAAFPKFQMQAKILEAAERKFESSLFEIKQVLQADIFDSELDTARELLKNGYIRASGAVAGVVLEKHLEQLSMSHNVKIKDKSPSISDYNNTFKEMAIIDIPTWRFIQHLADLRNICDHKKDREPKPEEVDDLINGVEKISKTVF